MRQHGTDKKTLTNESTTNIYHINLCKSKKTPNFAPQILKTNQINYEQVRNRFHFDSRFV